MATEKLTYSASGIRNNEKISTFPQSIRIFVFFYPVLTGCSRQTKDKLLRTFFDGVPGSNQSSLSKAPESEVRVSQDIKITASAVKKTEVVFHPPYMEKQCDSCHETKFSQKLASEPKILCFTCHDDFIKNKKVIHYPVDEGSCLECHDPHQASNKKLLKKPLPQICFNCHDEKDILSNPMHEGQVNCTECHNPHASNEEKLLK